MQHEMRDIWYDIQYTWDTRYEIWGMMFEIWNMECDKFYDNYEFVMDDQKDSFVVLLTGCVSWRMNCCITLGFSVVFNMVKNDDEQSKI